MLRKIIEFDRDELGDWRALLNCGHFRHFRHDPPLVTREWVLSERDRSEKIGVEVECRKCAPSPATRD